jgi:hypothetical protein
VGARWWIDDQGDATLEDLWLRCSRGDWLMWSLAVLGVDVTGIGYWCAERARQHVLCAIDAEGVTGPDVDALRACAPIVDAATAHLAQAALWAVQRPRCGSLALSRIRRVVEAAAAVADWVEWDDLGEGAWFAARASSRACVATQDSSPDEARDSELLAIAKHVRTMVPWSVVAEAIARKGGGRA